MVAHGTTSIIFSTASPSPLYNVGVSLCRMLGEVAERAFILIVVPLRPPAIVVLTVCWTAFQPNF